jgi:two-component system, cell cycle response regulator
MSGFIVALCDLNAKDARLLEIVLTRAPGRKHEFKLVNGAEAGYADIVIVDADRPPTDDIARLKTDSPEIEEIFISDSGAGGRGEHRIARKSLVLHCFRLLESIADSKLRGELAQPPAPKPAAPAPQVEAIKNEPPPAALTLTALVVDDSAAVRTQLEVTLKRAGLNVDTAENAENALNVLKSRRYDLVFLDVVMPGMNGYDLCRQVRALPSGRYVPVVMLTSRTSPFDRARGALAGCDTYLTKPVAVKDFYAAVHKALSKRYSADELAARSYKKMG